MYLHSFRNLGHAGRRLEGSSGGLPPLESLPRIDTSSPVLSLAIGFLQWFDRYLHFDVRSRDYTTLMLALSKARLKDQAFVLQIISCYLEPLPLLCQLQILVSSSCQPLPLCYSCGGEVQGFDLQSGWKVVTYTRSSAPDPGHDRFRQHFCSWMENAQGTAIVRRVNTSDNDAQYFEIPLFLWSSLPPEALLYVVMYDLVPEYTLR